MSRLTRAMARQHLSDMPLYFKLVMHGFYFLLYMGFYLPLFNYLRSAVVFEQEISYSCEAEIDPEVSLRGDIKKVGMGIS
jgi:hypothetical protein